MNTYRGRGRTNTVGSAVEVTSMEAVRFSGLNCSMCGGSQRSYLRHSYYILIFCFARAHTLLLASPSLPFHPFIPIRPLQPYQSRRTTPSLSYEITQTALLLLLVHTVLWARCYTHGNGVIAVIVHGLYSVRSAIHPFKLIPQIVFPHFFSPRGSIATAATAAAAKKNENKMYSIVFSAGAYGVFAFSL